MNIKIHVCAISIFIIISANLQAVFRCNFALVFQCKRLMHYCYVFFFSHRLPHHLPVWPRPFRFRPPQTWACSIFRQHSPETLADFTAKLTFCKVEPNFCKAWEMAGPSTQVEIVRCKFPLAFTVHWYPDDLRYLTLNCFICLTCMLGCTHQYPLFF